MTTTLLRLVADLELSLAAATAVGATTATLSSATDSDGNSLPTGKYGFTIDADNSAKEFIVCDLNGTALTGILSINKQGTSSSGFANYHRIGAPVTITDWAILSRMLNNLDGTTGFNSATPLQYDAQPDTSDPLTIPTVQFVLDTASGGTVTFNRQIISGDAGENVSAGDWVYYNTTDGEWYKTDADDTSKCLNVQIGKAIGAGTDGLPIDGGIFISGTETVATYVAGTTYYLSNTAGAISTSAGTNSVVVGVGDGNGDLIVKTATFNQINALAGGGPGTPSINNKFITEDTLVDVQTFTSNDTWTKPTGAATVEVYCIGGGGGGGGGYGTGASESGGAGGGAGGFVHAFLTPSSLTATVAVTVGTGGAGGAGTAGAPVAGTAGGNSTFGSYITATGGAGGTAGQTGGGAAAAVTSRIQIDGIYATTAGTSAAGASGAGNVAAGGAGVSANFFVPTGGGGGGGAGQAGGAGGAIASIQTVAGGTAGTAGNIGGSGNQSSSFPIIGTGGGGGGGASGNGANGGNGALYGAGGGGGGGSADATGGTGGSGANGVVVVITTF